MSHGRGRRAFKLGPPIGASPNRRLAEAYLPLPFPGTRAALVNYGLTTGTRACAVHVRGRLATVVNNGLQADRLRVTPQNEHVCKLCMYIKKGGG